MRRLLCTGVLAGALAVSAAAASYADASAASALAGTSDVTRLFERRSVSEWAYPLSAAVAHAKPSAHSRAVGKLRFFTSDKQAELYVALASATLASGHTWVQVELPRRPNGMTGWVPREALGSLHVVHGYLLINRRTLRATLFRKGHAIFSAPVGVGKASTVTPAGSFYVLEKLRSLGPFYGPFAIGTSAYAPTLSEWPGGGVVGIHGTNEPQLIPGRPSHGCIRMRNGDITRLWRMISLGTPIEIV